MKQMRFLKVLLLTLSVFALMGCGGGGGGGGNTAQQDAIDRIEDYADTNGTNGQAPTAEDYRDAGVDLNGTSVDDINAYIATLDVSLVDSEEDIQDIANDAGVWLVDTDGDGVLDYADTDDDNDGTSDVDEQTNGTNPKVNAVPVSNLASLQTVNEGATVSLDGSASSDVDSPALTYIWSFATKPTGSIAAFSDASTEPTFLADKPGVYTIQLVVSDGHSDSEPSRVSVEVLETLLMAKKTLLDGTEPWITNGTTEGTRQLANINNAPNSSSPSGGIVVNGLLYTQVTVSERRYGLCVSDGTLDGTKVLKSFGMDDHVRGFINLNGTLYFMVRNVLWKSNGTIDGTVEVIYIGGSFDARINSYVVSNGVIYALYYKGSGRYSIWKSNGTSAGTIKDLATFPSGSRPSVLTLSNGKIYFRLKDPDNGQELWALDTATDDVAIFSDIKSGVGDSYPNYMTYVGDRLYFSADDGIRGREIFRINDAGDDVESIDIKPDAGGSSPRDIVSLNGRLYFTADDGTHGRELWRMNDAGDNVEIIDSTVGAEGTDPRELTVVGGLLYMMVGDVFSKFDTGTNLIIPIKDIGGKFEQLTIDSTGKLYFLVEESRMGSDGYALWSSDGTVDGTNILKEHSDDFKIDPWSNVFLTAFGNKVFFPAIDTEHGEELWSSDGTDVHTTIFKDMDTTNKGSMKYVQLDRGGHAKVGYVHYFMARHEQYGTELWKYNGAETVVVSRDKNLSIKGSLTDYNGTLYFVANDHVHGEEVWKSDGTSGGTVMVADIKPQPGGRGLGKQIGSIVKQRRAIDEEDSSYPRNLTVVNNALYFSAYDGEQGREIWKTDGSTTEKVTDMADDKIYIPDIVNAEGTIYFVVRNRASNKSEMWRIAADNTVKISNFDTANNNIDYLTVMGDTVYFVADDGSHGKELWKTNTTGVEMVSDLHTGASGSNPKSLTVHDSKLYFRAYNGTQTSLWSYDGSVLEEVSPGTHVGAIRSVGDTLYFVDWRHEHMGELWKLQDGTVSMFTDMDDTDLIYDNTFLGDIGGKLVFKGKNRSETLYKLWKTDGTDEGTAMLYPHDGL